jgi:Ca-activated chloride channel family protein
MTLLRSDRRSLRRPIVAPLAALVALVAGAPRLRAQGLEVGTNGAIRVEVAHVEATIEESVARVEVDETFRNTTGSALQGVYRFQLPVDAVVGSFSMWMEGKERQGRVLEAREARAIYDSIVRKRKDPGLLEQVGWRDFQVDVFPIPAQDTVRVKLVYAHVVHDDLGVGSLEIALPQRCGPVGDLRVHVSIADHGLAGLASPSHPDAKLELRDERGGSATLTGDGLEPKGPFVLQTIPRRLGFDVALLADRPAGAESGHFVARVVPRLERATPLPRAVVFVVDRSGSMEGHKIEQARAALLAGLATLRPGDRFDVVSFASDVTTLGEGKLLDATSDELAKARRFACELDASGGTNLGGALDAALAARSGAGDRLFTVVLVTDGDPTVGETNPERLLARWRAQSGSARLFAFGVGDDVKEFLLTKLAVEGRGEARYVRDEQNLEVPLAALFERLRTPLLVDPTLVVEGGGVTIGEQEPRRLPDLFQGRALVVAGRFTGSGPATLRLRGRASSGVVELAVPVEFPSQTPPRPHVAQIWAKTRVERLLDDLRASGPNAELRDEVKSLGLKHQLVTPYTSFLVLEDDPRLAQGAIEGHAAPNTNGPPEPRARVESDDRAPRGTFVDDGTETIDRNSVPVDPESDGSDGSGGTSIGAGEAGHRGTGVPSAFAARRAGGAAAGGMGGAGGRGGTTQATLATVSGHLQWLRRHRSPGGGWDFATFDAQCGSEKCDGRGEPGHEAEATGLALLNFLGSGDTTASGQFQGDVRSAVRHLAALQQEDGSFVVADAPDRLRQHAISTLAIVEAFGATSPPTEVLRRPALDGVAFLLRARAEHGAWNFADGAVDLEATALATLALRSAETARLDVDAESLRRAHADVVAALDAITDRATGLVAAPKRGGESALPEETANAIALATRVVADDHPENDELAAKGAAWLEERAPSTDASALRDDPNHWYFGSIALRQLGGDAWKKWGDALRTVVVGRQLVDVSRDDCGSFEPSGPDAKRLGRVGATALAALTLEVYYRYPRVVGVRRR